MMVQPGILTISKRTKLAIHNLDCCDTSGDIVRICHDNERLLIARCSKNLFLAVIVIPIYFKFHSKLILKYLGREYGELQS